jgi:virginiamycin B lyase
MPASSTRGRAAEEAAMQPRRGSDDEDSGNPTSSITSAATSATTLPEAEDVATLGTLTIPARPFPDFMLAVGDTVWVSGVEPGIVGYDAVTGEVRAESATGAVPLAMEQGFGSLWAGEGTGGIFATVVRIDPASGTATARIPLPSPGLRPESSLAVTEDAVWALVDGEDAGRRLLVAVDPATDTVRGTFVAPPAAEALRGGFGSLWVATSGQSVVRVDPSDGSTQAIVGTGSGSRFMAVGDDAVWVLNQKDGTVSRIDPESSSVVATVQVSDGRIRGGDIAAGDNTVWIRTGTELATAVDPETNDVVRVLGPPGGSGSIAVTDGAVWLTAHDHFVVLRVPTA